MSMIYNQFVPFFYVNTKPTVGTGFQIVSDRFESFSYVFSKKKKAFWKQTTGSFLIVQMKK